MAENGDRIHTFSLISVILNPIATPNFTKYLSVYKKCFVYAFSQVFNYCDVNHFGPERNKAEGGQTSQPKIVE